MLKTTPILLSVSIVLILSQACSVPGISTPDSNSMNTAIAQTIVAALTQTSQAIIPITGLESPTAAQTFTPELPTATQTPTETLTPTPVIPQISVSVPTNCRVGPGKVYDRVGALLAA